MKRIKTGASIVLAMLCCILMCTGIVYATGDDTDGTELQVAQPVILEVQLGPQWAGVEFQLKTEAGLYPGTIAVGQDGVLRTELGSSGSYVLSCMNSGTAVPSPDDTSNSEASEQLPEPTLDSIANDTVSDEGTTQEPQDEDPASSTTGGIPVMHIVLFGGGLLLAVGALVAMRVIRNRRSAEHSPQDPYDEGDEDDEYEY